MDRLSGKRVVLGVSGGIAVYKTVELVRALQKAGADLQIVMTSMAKTFVGEETFSSISGKPVLSDVKGMEHITVPHSSDIFIVAPATANIIGKFANGIADDLLSTMLLATECPIIFVPSMNTSMWKNPSVKKNVDYLKKSGVLVVEPEEGELACGEYGEGRFPQIEKIIFFAEYALSSKELSGKEVLITAGGTREFIDTIRFISNSSSGFMGYCLAYESLLRGAKTTLVTCTETYGIETFGASVAKVISSEDMYKKVMEKIDGDGVDIFISSAAVSDFKPLKKAQKKIKKDELSGDKFIVELEKTKDILLEVSTKIARKRKIIIGFALEDDESGIESARKKLRERNLDAIVFNTISSINSERGNFWLLTPSEEKYLGELEKKELAFSLFEFIKDKFKLK